MFLSISFISWLAPVYHNWVFILLHESVPFCGQSEAGRKTKRRTRKCFRIHRLAERLWHLCTTHQECLRRHLRDHVMPEIWVWTHSLYQGMYCCSQQRSLSHIDALWLSYNTRQSIRHGCWTLASFTCAAKLKPVKNCTHTRREQNKLWFNRNCAGL